MCSLSVCVGPLRSCVGDEHNHLRGADEQACVGAMDPRRLLLLLAACATAFQPSGRPAGQQPRPTRRIGPTRLSRPALVHPVRQYELSAPGLSYIEPMAREWIQNGVPRWVTLLDELIFVLASIVFIFGSYAFFPGRPFEDYVTGCELYVLGSAAYFGLAIFAVYEIFEDARIAGRPVQPDLIFEQALYLIGSIFFVAGTILFTPTDGYGDAVEAAAAAAAAGAPVEGESVRAVSAPLFGRQFYLGVGEAPAPLDSSVIQGDELFVVGSLLFSVAAFVSALKAAGETAPGRVAVIRRRVSVAAASLYELGGVAFVVGTLGFIPGSALGISQCPDGPRTLEEAGATLFVVGSAMYTLGSVLIFGFQAWNTYRDDDGAPPPLDLALAAAPPPVSSGERDGDRASE